MRKRLLCLGAIAVAMGAVVLLPADPGRAATCFSDPAVIASADVVFVGALSGVSASGDQATFAVDEVWTSGNVGGVVVVNATPAWFSGYLAGDYLVMASVIDGSLRLGDGECAMAAPWDASFANLRPATAHPPQEGSDTAGPSPELLLLIGVAVLLVAVSALAFRRTRAPGE